MSERLPLSRTLAALRARLNQELVDEYKQVSPTRDYFLEGPPPTRASCAVFQLRTESVKTKDWRWRHNQPLDDEPQELLQQSKKHVPVGPHKILRRSEDADLRKVQDEGLYAFVESLHLDGLLMVLANSGLVLLSSVPRQRLCLSFLTCQDLVLQVSGERHREDSHPT